MTSQIVRRFQLAGQLSGAKIVQARDTHKRVLLDMMKTDGFAPLLDIDPVFEQTWIKDDIFEFVYTWQAVYVGLEKAWQTEGILGGRMIPSTQKSK
jgi:hypothetical protein